MTGALGAPWEIRMKNLMMMTLITLASMGAQAALTCQGLSVESSRQTATQVIVDKETNTISVTKQVRIQRRSMLTTKIETSASTQTHKLAGVKKTMSGKDFYVKSGVLLKVRNDGEALLVEKLPWGDVMYRQVSCN